MPSLLQQLKDQWLKNGWNLAHLDAFRMEDPPEDPPPDPPEPKSFTQEQVQQIAAKEKREGRAAAEKELMQKFGVSTVEEAQEIIAKAKKAEEDTLSDTEKAKTAAERDKAEAAKAKSEAAHERQIARIERALVKAGLDDDEIEFLAPLVKVDDDADADAIKTAVEELKTKMPRLFPAEGEGDKKPPPKKAGPKPSDPGNGPPKPPSGNTADRAKELLAQRHPKKVTTTQ